MKKTILSLALVAALAPASSVFAADATVNFTGEIYATTCEVATDSKDKEVVLGKHASSYFDAIGKETAKVPFTIELTGCSAATNTNMQVGLKIGEGNVLTGSDLAIDSYADAVIAIYDKDGAAIDLADKTNHPAQALKAGDLTFNYQASIKATKANPAPKVISQSLNFDIVYK